MLWVAIVCALLGAPLAITSAQTTDPALVGVEWQWQEFQSMDDTTTTVTNPANYTLTLNADGTFNIQADCNVGSGSYTLNGDGLA